MPAAYVPMMIDQGEDWTCQLVWTDDFDEPQNVVPPCRLDVKDAAGQTVLSLVTPDDPPPPGTIPEIGLSSEMGVIQLHVTRTASAAIQAGQYNYDLFVSVDDGDDYAGEQVQRIMYGQCTVNKRITQL